MLTGVAALVFLSACAGIAPGRLAPDNNVSAYAFDGRFSLRHGDKAYSGRISWEHSADTDRVRIADPFGGGVAELDRTPARTRVVLVDGRVAEAADPDAALFQLTGMPLPVGAIGGWLTGRGGRREGDLFDAAGRAQERHRDGWRLRFDYADAMADELPARIFAHRDDDLELRLAIEQWHLAP